MAIRIYALSQELKIDSKELVDICTKAGVTGKGSALASLTDEEVAKVKAYVAGGQRPPAPRQTSGPPQILPRVPSSPPAAPAPTPAPVPEPPALTPPSGEIPVIAASASSGPLASKMGSRGADAPARTAAQSPSAAPPAAASPTAPAAPVGFSRQDYVGPSGNSGTMRVIASRGKKREGDGKTRAEGDPPRTVQKREPVVKLAAIPKSDQPDLKPASNEPAPQKPIMSLPKDAIRGAKAGTRPPLEHLTRGAEKGRKADPPKRGAAADATPMPPLEPRGPKDRKRPAGEFGDRSDLADMASARAVRQQSRKTRKPNVAGAIDEEDDAATRRMKRLIRKGTNTAAPRKEKIVVDLPCTVRSFSEATGVGNNQIQKVLIGMGVLASINAAIDEQTASHIALELGLEVELRRPPSLEETLLKDLDKTEEDTSLLLPRPPVVTFLGHVDHGKTSLLDRIIGSNVVAGEAGGITQHIRAYSITKGDRVISFVDTPGHEAFTEMRARGANVTDIAVLVVAADDGVMPQTEEALSHARAAGVPIVVALNKIDLPGVDTNRILQQLAAQNLLVTEWGGDVELVKCSALKGTGIDALLETLLLTADIHELKANPNKPGVGTCLEASQQSGRGVAAKFIVRSGTLKVGDVVVCGAAHGRIKAMHATLPQFRKVDKAGPSMPVDVIGLDVAPSAGEKFYVLSDIAQAREIAALREQSTRETSLSGRVVKVSFDEFQRRLSEGKLGKPDEVVTLNLILRADVRGSIEAIQKELGKLEHPEVRVNILQASVGGVTVADVTLADASAAVIVSFNVIPDEAARILADERGVEIRRYDIIYKVADDIRAMLEGRLKPEERAVELGRALVKQVFSISRVGTIAGCQVMDGAIERNCRMRVYREGRIVGEYELDTLRREKDDAKSVPKGMECGIKLKNYNDVKVGDVLEAYKIEEIARTLS